MRLGLPLASIITLARITSPGVRAGTRSIGLLALLLAAVSVAVPAGAWGSAPKLQVLGQSTIEVTAGQGDDGKDAYADILNAGPGPATVTTTFQASSSAGVHAVIAPVKLKAGQVGRIKVSLSGLRGLTGVADGQLVFAGGATPVARSVSITPAPQPATDWPLWLVLGGVAAAILLRCGVVANTPPKALARLAPGPTWKFDDSWATTLTAVGGLLGTVLGGVTFPAHPRQIDKDTLVELSALFAAVVVLAPFLLRTLGSRESQAAEDQGLWTTNRTLVLVSSITFGAVIAELATLSLLGWELAEGAWWRWAVLGVIAGLGVLATRYAWITVSKNARANWSARRQRARETVPLSGEVRLVGGGAPFETIAEQAHPIVVGLHRHAYRPIPTPSLL